jgi:hypothetical protein
MTTATLEQSLRLLDEGSAHVKKALGIALLSGKS